MPSPKAAGKGANALESPAAYRLQPHSNL